VLQLTRLNFSGTPADGVLSIQLGNITDTAGNALSGNLIYFVTDVTNPTLTSVPAAGVSGSLRSPSLTLPSPGP
jgi:hypothetical protein